MTRPCSLAPSGCCWDHGRPVEVGVLAGALQREPAAVAAAVDRLEQAGVTRRDPAGRLLGSHGLSVAPTHHELLSDGRRRWTWCAYDAVGILGAPEADGRVRSRSPHSGTLIELTFDAGQPAATDAVVFMAEEPCRSVIDDWCPLVNLFEHDHAAAAWARQHGISGAARPVAQATRVGAAAWRAYLWPGATPAGCCPQWTWPSGATVDLEELRRVAAGSGGAGGRPAQPPAAHRADTAAAAEGEPVPLLPQVVDRSAAAFDRALERRDAAGMVAAILAIDRAIVAWSADTLQSDDVDRAHSMLRSLVVRLGEAAAAGLRDPGEALAPIIEPLVGLRALLHLL
jgi:hypothetical protein